MTQTLIQTPAAPEVLTEQEWVANRSITIGASDVPTILGLNSYESPFSLFQRKMGRIPKDRPGIPARVGHALETLISDLYTETTGRELQDPGDYTIFRHPDIPYLVCTPDRLTVDEQGRTGAVELKTLTVRLAHEVQDDARIEYMVQLQTQLAVMGLEWGDIVVLVGNEELKRFTYPRREDVIAEIIQAVQEFHDRLVNDNPPMIDGHAATAKALRLLHPDDNGETVALGVDTDGWLVSLNIAKAEIKKHEAAKLEAENHIKAALGAYTFADLPGGGRLSYKTQERSGYLKVADTPETRMTLERTGVGYTETPGSKFRVLRELKRNN